MIKPVVMKILALIHKVSGWRIIVRVFKDHSVDAGKRLFSGRRLKEHKNQYKCVDPMPTQDELSDFYRSIYWDGRGDLGVELKSRDVGHFHLILKYCERYLRPGDRILNFGAGNGGISNLLSARGYEVFNIEPGRAPGVDHMGVSWMQSLPLPSQLESKFRLIYSSHALEHVSDIDELISSLKLIGDEKTLVYFFEVPNGLHVSSGAPLGVIKIPHTYYFFPEFFEGFGTEPILNTAAQYQKGKALPVFCDPLQGENLIHISVRSQ